MPCESKEEIRSIQSSLTDHESRLSTISANTNSMRQEMNAFMSEVRETMVSLRDFTSSGSERLKINDRNIDMIFGKLREQELEGSKNREAIRKCQEEARETIRREAKSTEACIDDLVRSRVAPIEEYIGMQKGKRFLLKDMRVTIPMICTIIVTAIMIYNFMRG